MKTEVQETGAEQQQSIPLLQIVLMKFPGRRFRAMRRNTVEIIPGKAAYSAIIVGLAPKVELTKWQRRKLGYRTRRKQACAASVISADRDNYFCRLVTRVNGLVCPPSSSTVIGLRPLFFRPQRRPRAVSVV